MPRKRSVPENQPAVGSEGTAAETESGLKAGAQQEGKSAAATRKPVSRGTGKRPAGVRRARAAISRPGGAGDISAKSVAAIEEGKPGQASVPSQSPAETAFPAEVENILSSAVSLQEQIALLAYSYWEARGRQGGSPEDDWLRAEREILERRKPADG